ncbi:MAG: tRNA (guanosine(37)-N1)-methyltransferase TrmD [Parcubacteria group bacterium CG10_big_fil_rev_8_21_14_0_10_35_15]|nr:MAG: tRNA (guanosine(37)-N1)-methyltransferase TrmD [Parcubacteria group bacterium CG10_big_fil_rev_8_21_14_0_10_35_15]
MIQFDIITIFPHFFDSFLNESIIKRAQKQKLIKVRVFNLRDYADDRHRTVDDKPYGGGRGMVLKLEPMYKAISSLNKSKKIKTILFSPRGKKFNQGMAFKYSKLKRIILVCGRYEGIDERVAKYLVNEQLSIGDYVMMGGEVAAMAVMESVARLVPGVLGHSELLGERIEKTKKGFTEFPQYTRPEIFNPRLRQSFGGQAKKSVKWRVPGLLLKGNHKKIEDWRRRHLKTIN